MGVIDSAEVRALTNRRAVTAGAASGVPLQLAGLAKQFGARSVLESLDLNIAAGEFVALVGRSGCGKTPLLRLLAGLDAPSSGSILSGYRIPTIDRSASARRKLCAAALPCVQWA